MPISSTFALDIDDISTHIVLYDDNNSSYFSFLKYLNPLNLYYYFFGNNNNQIEQSKFPNKRVFIVSVLKTNFYWSKKYITYDDNNKNKLLGKAYLIDHTIYIDQNGFGWIIPKKGKKCLGEIYDVIYEDFLDIEFFYGQCDSKMEEVNVKLINGEEVKAYAYIVKKMWENVKVVNDKEENEVEEYGLDIQEKRFNPMKHIINQQERYLNMSLEFNLKDSW